ncbi:MAG: hypothetical protein ACRBF0_24090 [Calditrichia bacterium]
MVLNFISAAIFGIFILIGWLSYTRYLRYQFRVNTLNSRLNMVLEKLGKEQEVIKFLESPVGQRLFNNLTSAGTSTKIPIIVMLSSGIISLSTGIGSWCLTFFVEDDFIFGAVFMTAIGIGFLIAAGVTFVLSRKWEILDEPEGLTDIYMSQTTETGHTDTGS